MAKIHGDFGDMTRYDVHVDLVRGLWLICQDCDLAIAHWDGSQLVNLADVNKVAAEHETKEEQPQ